MSEGLLYKPFEEGVAGPLKNCFLRPRRRLRCAVHQRLSHGFPISYVVGWLLDRAPSERVRGRALENSPSAHRSGSSKGFSEY